MRRVVAVAAFLGLMCVSFGSAELVKSRPPERDLTLAPGMTRTFVDTLKGSERALAIASGNGRACLGLYVFDTRGNCVAWDDISSPATSDDLIAVWYPAEEGRYSIDLHSGGFESSIFKFLLR